MIRIKMDVKKIDKSLLFTGSKGTYMDVTLMDNKDGTDQYGNDGFAVQDVGKEKREAGIKGPIIGNWKYVGAKPLGVTSPEHPQHRSGSQGGAAVPPKVEDEFDDSDIPF